MTPAAPSFLRAVVPPVVRLGGRRLLPLTLGHAVLLRAVGSPFAPYPAVSRGEARIPNEETAAGSASAFATRNPSPVTAPGLGDVALARFILSRPWREARDTMDSRRSRRGLVWWGLCCARDWMIPALAEHIAADTAVPPYEILVRGEGRRGACLELILLESLIARGYHHDDALDTPVALAWWLHLARFDGEGTLRLATTRTPATPPPPAPEYPPAVMAAWAEAQQQRMKAGRAYDPDVDSIAVFAAGKTETATITIQNLASCSGLPTTDQCGGVKWD